MPTFNSELFVDEAISSVRFQTHYNFFLNISDNGSTDKTIAICESHAASDSRIRVYRQHRNLGAVRNFLFLLEIAETKLFSWIGSDDMWSENWLESLIQAQQAPGFIGAFGRVIQIDDSSNVVVEHPANGAHFPWTSIEESTQRVGSFLVSHPREGRANLIYGLFEVEALKRASAFTFVESRKDSDNDVVQSLLSEGRIACCPDASLFKRLGVTSKNYDSNPLLRLRNSIFNRLRTRRQYSEGMKLLSGH